MVSVWNNEVERYAVQSITRILNDERVGLKVVYDLGDEKRDEKMALNANILDFIKAPENYQRLMQKILEYLDKRFLDKNCPKTIEMFPYVLKASDGLPLAWKAYHEIEKENLETQKYCQSSLQENTLLKM